MSGAPLGVGASAEAAAPRVLAVKYAPPPVPADIGAWRDGKIVVMDGSRPLPNRCVKCNRAAGEKRVHLTLRWYPWWVWLVPLILVMFLTKTAKVWFPVCVEHRVRRIVFLWAAYLFLIGGFVLLMVGLGDDREPMAWAGGGLLATSPVLGAIGSLRVRAARIEERFVRVRGVCEAYREELPEWVEVK